MSTIQQATDRRRFRLAANDNEIVVGDELDTQGHRLATNDNEITIEKMRRATEDPSEDLGPTGLRRRAMPEETDEFDPAGIRAR